MNFDELRKCCESAIETHLLRALYPELGPDAQKKIQAQYMIDYYDMLVEIVGEQLSGHAPDLTHVAPTRAFEGSGKGKSQTHRIKALCARLWLYLISRCSISCR